jgi:hypothetical protein
MSTTTPQLSAFSSQLSGATRAQSPLNFLRALSARIRAAFGADLSADLLDEGLADIALGLDHAGAQAHQIETRVERLRRHWTEFWSDGRLDPRERRILAQDHRALAQSTHAHTTTLASLR